MELVIDKKQSARQACIARLPIEKGIVFLREPGLPALTCNLHDLSEAECGCVASMGTLSDEVATGWLHRLEAGRSLLIDISSPPHLPGLQLHADLIGVQRIDAQLMKLDLRFVQVEAEEFAVLQQALLALSADKLKSIHAPENASQMALGHEDEYRGRRLGEILMMLGKVTRAQLDEAERCSRGLKER